MACVVSIVTVGMNSKSFPWPVECVHGPKAYPKSIFYDVRQTQLAKLYDHVSSCSLMTSWGHERYVIQ